ncbi:MAG TPA: adenylate/guanylate cyclase domain-containing protein [Solirubrobacteraceae bacterium]|nr:adenylate/guanylate cyclase domain-containing protein [Solirubrobacteraceae bacterium]
MSADRSEIGQPAAEAEQLLARLPECGICGWVGPQEGRFCTGCGAPLAGRRVEHRQSRKVVTVLFSDVTGFTTISERLDPEALREVMERYFVATRAVIERHGGLVGKFIGDAVMAVFGLPVVREDDALRAVRAAVEIGEELKGVNSMIPVGLAVDLTVSTGVNTGEVFVSDDVSNGGTQMGELSGDAVNVAARLESAAAPGEVFLGEVTFRLTRGRIEAERLELALKGKSEKVVAFRLTRLTSPAARPDRRLTARTVGREKEAARVASAFEEAAASKACVLVTVLGVAGSGKSRLVGDALESLRGRARLLSGRCLPYGEATIYWPLTEIACQAAGISHEEEPATAIAAIARLLSDDPDDAQLAVASRLAGAFGLGPLAGAAEEIPPDVVRLLRALASHGPLVAVIEDLHWASPGLLATLEHVATRVSDAPLLLICTARPELLEARPDWPRRAPSAQRIPLESLGEKDCAVLVAELLGGSQAARALAGPVGSVASGNPLVVEEVLAMLVDDGVLTRDADGWRLQRAVEEIRIPPTIEAILAARLDRLSGGERDVIEGAAVVGKEFNLTDIEALGNEDPETLGRTISALIDKQLIAAAADMPSDYRFHHMLVRDAAYAAMPKRRRADLHERFADFIESSPGGRLGGPYGEIAGEHLERACLLRRELGAGNREVGDLAHRAGTLLDEAGRRAVGFSDFRAARRIYARGEAVVARDDPLRPVLLTGLAVALHDCGLPGDAQSAARDAVLLAERLGAGAVRPRAALALVQADVFCGDRLLEDALVEIRDTLAELERIADDRSIAWGWMTLGGLCFFGARFTEAWMAASQAVARVRSSAPADLPYCLVGLCYTLPRSPMPIAEVSQRCEEALSLVQPDTIHAARIETSLAYIEGMSGRFAAARRRFAGVTEICERYEDDYAGGQCLLDWGHCELLARDFESAESRFRRARALFASLDDLYSAEAAAFHARAQARLGQYSDALEQARWASEHALANHVEARVWWRIAAALALAGMGELERAEDRAREAVVIARPTEAPLLLGDTLSCLGEVLLAQGRSAEGRSALQEAIGIFDAKGVTPGVTAARELLRSSTSVL